MAETQNIATMADLLSSQLFNSFFWKRSGPKNINWPCEQQQTHNRKTHPTDAVFYYDEPYKKQRTYLNTDLKSYARNSINAHTLKSSLQSLASALRCTEQSQRWAEVYVHENVNYRTCGLLFIYNHDGEYDKNFSDILATISPKDLDIPKGSKLVVLGPQDIHWLNNLHIDITQMRGLSEIPPRENCKFWYPHLQRRTNVQELHANAATLEMLTSPWVIMECMNATPEHRKEYLVFTRRPCESVNEFLFLFSHLAHYQLLNSQTQVSIRALQPHDSAPALLEKAKTEYVETLGGPADIEAALGNIKFNAIPQIQTAFSEIEIGME